MKSMHAIAVSYALLSLLLSIAPPTQAAPVTYSFAGRFDVPNGSLSIYTDTSFKGSFTYDPAIGPRPQAQAGAAQYDALIAFDLEILEVPSQFAFRMELTPGAPTGVIGIDEATNGAPSDLFRIFFGAGPRVIVETPTSLELSLINFGFERVSGSVFDDALSLPATLDLADFDNTFVELTLLDTDFLNVSGRITSLELRDTPSIDVTEPGTIGLLGVAAAGLAAVARRKRP